ncbi:MAG TPA: hypothetical protein V6C76_14845 [Drouetiella sp.]
MNKKSTIGAAMLALFGASALVLPSQAEDSTFFSTTTGYVVAPAKYAGKAIMMPFRVFSRNSGHEVVATSKTVTYVKDATIGAGPNVIVTNIDGTQNAVSTTLNANPTLYVTTGATINSMRVYLPNDLINRRDDLIARIYTLKAQGKLSDSQASGLLAEVQTVAAMPCPVGCAERTTSSARQVKMMYREFDKVSNDILKESKQGDKQLAGKYSVVSM